MSKRKTPTVQIIDGKWYALGGYDRQVCCDCGLVHRLAYKMERGRIFERVIVDRRATRSERNRHGIIVLNKKGTA